MRNRLMRLFLPIALNFVDERVDKKLELLLFHDDKFVTVLL